MGRARNLFDLALAVGAIAGSAAVLSPQLLWNDGQMQSITSARAISTSSKSLPLAPFVGIAQFIKQPVNYQVDINGQVAEVTAASLVGEQMTIDYAYESEGDRTTGVLAGTVNDRGAFSGVQLSDTQLSDTQLSGIQFSGANLKSAVVEAKESSLKESGLKDSVKESVNFVFAADGTATSIEGKPLVMVKLSR